MNIQDEIPTVKYMVQTILERYPVTRNSDKVLYYHIATDVVGVKVDYQEWERLFAISFVSVRRVRQKFQEENMYLPTDPEIAAQRRRNAFEMKEMMPTIEMPNTPDPLVKPDKIEDW